MALHNVQASQDAIDLATVKKDALFQQTVGMTPDQVVTYVQTNVVDLPTVIQALESIARLLIILERQVNKS